MNSKTKYSPSDEKINSDFYGYFLNIHEDDGWGDDDKYGNFAYLAKLSEYTHTPFENASVLDVGCGTGDLSAYLRELGLKSYTGIDLFPLSAKLAQLKFPHETFLIGDFLTTNFEEKFDFVFFSGTLAAILESDNYTIMEAFIDKMWSLCIRGVALNFLTRKSAQEKDDMLFLYDLDRVLEIVHKVAPTAKIEHILNRAGDKKEFLQTHLYLIK
ncbi:MAG: hypothetical protein QG600_578 [Patescibacteria group bacterium]|jgi:SAM-dependent methyltransferase|nr:hypothetical protein [Patescibacteria group bacterium]